MELAEAKFLNAFNTIPGVGAATLRKLKTHFGSFQTAWASHAGAYASACLDPQAHAAILERKQSIDPDREMQKLARGDIWMVGEEDPAYPPLLKQIPVPPAALYGRGRPEALTGWLCIAVVGTRRPTPYGLEAVEAVVPGLAAAGASIVSGLAMGIDTKAHQTALQERTLTVAVLGSGVDPVSVFPPENRGLAERIASSGGAVISEHAPGTPAVKEHFPMRNRIISGLSRATLVVEARERSGALITAHMALEQNRDVFAIPGSIFSATSRGTLALIRCGAGAVGAAHDILEALGIDAQNDPTSEKDPRLTPEERQIVALLGSARSVDAIKAETGLATGAILSTLSLLELKGKIRRLGNDTFQRA